MTSTQRQRYDLYLNTQQTGLIKAGEAVLLEQFHHLERFAFRYTVEYLEHSNAFSLDPISLPLKRGEILLRCSNGIPGILDDYLPDDWGRRVLAQLAFYRDKKKLNSHSCIEMLSLLSNSRIGALQWISLDEKPHYDFGGDISLIKQAEQAAQAVDKPEHFSDHLDEMSLLYLANAGTGVGGARPKALLHQDGKAYLAKFNRLNGDKYNNARVELACLLMAQAAGIDACTGIVETGINGREVLLLDRFDVVEASSTRKHIITANALLKNSETQQDKGGVFRYDDLANLIRLHSMTVEKDLCQLLRVMLFNCSINNLDDHERNFSFMVNESGYSLSPAYDMVPSLITGAYHVAGFQYSPSPPLASEVTSLGKVFGLPKTTIKSIAEEVTVAVKHWPQYAENAGVSEEDVNKVQFFIRT